MHHNLIGFFPFLSNTYIRGCLTIDDGLNSVKYGHSEHALGVSQFSYNGCPLFPQGGLQLCPNADLVLMILQYQRVYNKLGQETLTTPKL